MLYIKIENQNPVGYPVSESVLREIFSNISFPAEINLTEILELGYAGYVTTLPPLAGLYQTVAEIAPSFDGTVFTQQWELHNMSDQEKAAVNLKQLEESKSKQRQLLTNSDWTELPSVRAKNTTEWGQQWDNYRTSLRDLDKLESWPFIANWPAPPDTIPDVPPGESV